MEYADHDVAFIAEVDCTDDSDQGGDELCEEHGVDGFPALLWGNPGALQKYTGGRDYESMAAFAKEFVTKQACSLSHLDSCSDEEKKELETQNAYTDDELKAIVQKIAKAVNVEDLKHEVESDRIQDEYEKITTEHNAVLEQIKTDYNYPVLVQVLKNRGIAIPDPDDIEDDDDDDDMADAGDEL